MLPTKARCDAFLSVAHLLTVPHGLVQFDVLITALNKGYGRKRRYGTRRLAVQPLLP